MMYHKVFYDKYIYTKLNQLIILFNQALLTIDTAICLENLIDWLIVNINIELEIIITVLISIASSLRKLSFIQYLIKNLTLLFKIKFL